MASPLGDLSPDRFLQEYWQKKPCLVRRAFAKFEPLLNGDDLAGLACEEMAESRLVSGSFEAANWDIRHGPFSETDFAGLPEENWTLLVQDVEKHYAPLQVLMQQFSFIPSWRLDDLMISYAARGGSVGPHVDQYDVFLLQAEGRRRWQISEQFEPELLGDCELNVLRRFTPGQEWILEPGDMLYLPPNIAHHGVALEPGMTWSIGSRAPSAADLLQGLGEWFAFADDDGGRYSDPDLKPALRNGKIDQEALQNLRDFMLKQIRDAESLDTFLASFMSRFRLAHEPVSPPETLSDEAVRAALENGDVLFRNPWTRLTWIETESGASLFAAGQAYECVDWFALALCEKDRLHLEPGRLDHALLKTLTALINNGHFLLAPAD
jgi:50S ribosomal protein L16 3-hydroxylase